MKRSIKIPITESEKDLQLKLSKENDGRLKERIQFLYLLKTQQISSLFQASKILGRHRHTLRGWFEKYEQGGLNGLLERNTSPGGPSKFSPEILEKLKERLADPHHSFTSFKEIQLWLAQEFSLEVNYKHVHHVCRYKLDSSPKVPRPYNPRQNAEEVTAFKKTSASSLMNKNSSIKGIKV